MLSNEDILIIMADQRHDVPIDIVTEFTDSQNRTLLNQRLFKAKLLPIAPSLCFFEPDPNKAKTFSMSSYFSGIDNKYTLIPFGFTQAPLRTQQDFGMSYNTFCDNLPIQSYTICKDNAHVPKRVSNQCEFFKETNCNPELWSAGHLIAHRYTPQFNQNSKAATLQLKWNFIPEPHYWNCYQRSHLERQTLGGYYGVYPIYNLRFKHGRTVNKCKNKDLSLTYRPIPDGEFFVSYNPKPKTVSLYIPFVDQGIKVYDTKLSASTRDKLNKTITQHSVGLAGCPKHFQIDFTQDIKPIIPIILDTQRKNEKLASAQLNLFLHDTTNSLHHSAIVQREQAAAIEFNTPQNKIECALIFSDLLHRKKTQSYLSAVGQHAKILLDECEAEDSKTKVVADRLVKDFKERFPDQTASIDILERLRLKYI